MKDFYTYQAEQPGTLGCWLQDQEPVVYRTDSVGAVSFDEVRRGVIKHGYVPKGKPTGFARYLRRVLREEEQFVEDAQGRWHFAAQCAPATSEVDNGACRLGCTVEQVPIEGEGAPCDCALSR